MRGVKMFKLGIGFFFCLALLGLIFGCNDDDDTVHPSNPQEVLDAMRISPSTIVTSEFPTPSYDPLSPRLKVDKDSIFVIGNSYENIFLSLESGKAKGFLVKVKGAKKFFKVTSTSAVINYPGATLAFGFLLENEVKEGSFVLMYSVYDEQDRVSNIVERTVIVTSSPGKGSEFISARTWNLLKSIQPGTNDTTTAGKPEKYQYNEIIDCVNGAPDKTVQVTNEFDLNAEYTFSKNGKMAIVSVSNAKTYDAAASGSSCSLKYKESETIVYYEGKWSYYRAGKQLILQYYRYEVSINGTKTIYPDVIGEYKVSVSTDQKLIFYPTSEDGTIIILK